MKPKYESMVDKMIEALLENGCTSRKWAILGTQTAIDECDQFFEGDFYFKAIDYCEKLHRDEC
jgi:hypothetical protein